MSAVGLDGGTEGGTDHTTNPKMQRVQEQERTGCAETCWVCSGPCPNLGGQSEKGTGGGETVLGGKGKGKESGSTHPQVTIHHHQPNPLHP